MLPLLRTLLVFTLVSSMYRVSAQNLVVDPSFENTRYCPKTFVIFPPAFVLKDWKIPTLGSTDYMNACGWQDVSIPDNFVGHQAARSGDGYVHFLCYDFHSEYIRGQLYQPLEEGREYEVEFWVSLGERSALAAGCLGANLSHKKIRGLGYGMLGATPQIHDTSFVFNTEDWVRIQGRFTAEGGEKYITIGAFPRKGAPDFKPRNTGIKGENPFRKPMAFYYLDDVSVRLIEDRPDTAELVEEETKADSETAQSVVLENVNFETNRSILKEESHAALDELAQLMNTNAGMIIQLNGHTDNVGTEKENQELSEDRVQAVKNYLINKKIDPSRIQTKGFGSKAPIQSNETEAGRRANRRVEFQVINP